VDEFEIRGEMRGDDVSFLADINLLAATASAQLPSGTFVGSVAGYLAISGGGICWKGYFTIQLHHKQVHDWKVLRAPRFPVSRKLVIVSEVTPKYQPVTSRNFPTIVAPHAPFRRALNRDSYILNRLMSVSLHQGP
jgi:hypothetical protein